MPYAAIVLVVILWGSAASVSRSIGPVMTPLDLSLWRLSIGLVLLVIPLAATKLRSRRGRANPAPVTRTLRLLVPVWASGVAGFGLMIWLFFAAARLTLSSHLVLILSLTPICTMLLDRLLSKRRSGGKQGWGAVAVCLLGVAVMVGPGLSASGASLAGDALALAAMLSLSLYTLGTRQRPPGMTTLEVNVHGMAAGLLFLWLMLLATEGIVWPAGFTEPGQWLAVGYLGAASTGLAYLLYAWTLSRLPMDRVVPFIFLQPIVGVLLSAIWLNEAFTVNVALGTVGIIGGLVWNWRTQASPARRVAAKRQSV